MRLEHHLVGGYVGYISPYIIIIMYIWTFLTNKNKGEIVCGVVVCCVFETRVPKTYGKYTLYMYY